MREETTRLPHPQNSREPPELPQGLLLPGDVMILVGLFQIGTVYDSMTTGASQMWTRRVLVAQGEMRTLNLPEGTAAA